MRGSVINLGKERYVRKEIEGTEIVPDAQDHFAMQKAWHACSAIEIARSAASAIVDRRFVRMEATTAASVVKIMYRKRRERVRTWYSEKKLPQAEQSGNTAGGKLRPE